MATNKEQIENLEVGLGGLQDGMSIMKLNIVDRFHQMKGTINKLTKALRSNKKGSNNNNNDLGCVWYCGCCYGCGLKKVVL